MAANRMTICPVIPIRDIIIFPGVVSPILINRPISIRAVEEAWENARVVLIVPERQPFSDTLKEENLCRIGTLAKLGQNMRMPDGSMKVMVEGMNRAEVNRYEITPSVLIASCKILRQKTIERTPEISAKMRLLLREFEKYCHLDPIMPPDISLSLDDIDDPEILCDVAASHAHIKFSDKQKILETIDAEARLNELIAIMMNENIMLELENEIEQRVHSEIDKEQHDYYLQQKLKVINEELGDESPESEADELRIAAERSGMPENILERTKKEISKFAKLQPLSPEAAVSRSYIETLTEMPWNKSTEDCLDIKNAKKVLNEDHYGLDDVKKRIVEYLAVKKLAGNNMRAQVICFVGPPGVGKTSLGRSIARAMGRKFINISLGGMRDEAEIRGHRRTYVGALPGRIIQKIKQCGSNNPLILMDEIDKLGSDFRGDPSSALLEALDPEQNSHFVDNFLEVPFDLSNVMFITTANSTDTIPRPLLDRMEVIHLSGYVMEEKLNIARKHLIPKIITEHGLTKDNFKISDSVLKDIISSYTMESGVRSLDRQLCKIARRTATELTENDSAGKSISKAKAKEILGAPKLHLTKLPKDRSVGISIGLAWTESGGDVLLIESALMEGKGELSYTGNLGDIMQESAKNALAYIRSNADALGLSGFEWTKKDIHIHVPAGAVPKDGPSAGITLTVSLVSSLTGRRLNAQYAMTGEMSLHGEVLPIGGIREKILAAKRYGISEIILPEANRSDADELSEWVLSGVNLHFVSDVDEVMKLVLAESVL
ncbi:MAG: endopeptidase La [Synergistes sp.]|nr:endopeptidase La [Synergistes sp.]